MLHYMPFKETGQASIEGYLSVTCNAAIVPPSNGTTPLVKGMRMKLAQSYPRTAAKAHTDGLEKLKQHVKEQRSMMPSTKHYDFGNAFKHLNASDNMPGLNSKALHEHHRGRNARKAPANPATEKDDVALKM